jgi:hypothetical protein
VTVADIEQQLREAAQALRAGRKEEARSILLAVVDEQEHNERAWLFLSAAVETLEEQQICLENVLTINPTNDKARQGLERVNKALAARQARAPRASVPPFTADPEFATLSAPGEEAVPAGGGDAYGGWERSMPATSVEWGRAGDAPVYGSGQQVELPSEQEYADWVRGLNLAADGPDQPPAPGPALAAREDADRVLEEMLRSAMPAARGAAQATPTPARIPPASEQAWTGSLPEMIGQGGLTDAPVFAALADPESEPRPAEAPLAPDEQSYFRYIPADIEPAQGGLDGRALFYGLAVVALAVLNVVSFGYLLR